MRLPALLLVAILFAGCVRFSPQPISPKANALRLEQRSLADESFHRYAETNLHRTLEPWPPASWDVETLSLAAFYFNPDLALARTSYETIAAAKTTAAARPNPTLSVGPSYNTTTAIPSPWLVTASFDVPIETAGKRGYRKAHAAQLSDAARFDFATKAWNVRVQLRQALLELWSARESESLLKKEEEAQQTIVRTLQAELAAGGVAPLQVSRERMALEKTSLARLDAENRRAQALAQVARTIGLPAFALDSVPISLATFDQLPGALPSVEAQRRALLNRSDVLGALAEYAASESALQLEVARQFPDIHLSPGYEFDQGDNKWGVGIGVELPLLNQNRGPIAEAEARRREAAAKFDAVQVRVIGEVEAALLALKSAGQKYSISAELLEQARKQERAAADMEKAGEISRQAVAIARLETVNTELGRLEALLKLHQAAAALENSLQLPVELADSMSNSPAQIKSNP